ncbi:PREDICTED: uncharacterized protein ENSP00000361038 homolog [Elephantulus edwardii]|uniref:uncharacterized protein ENSP00000361038 homolog n=1 Tax=Elephantulus edwardii TaxID=28737 RepID=UPI0003F09727|nr:PREDICTED: uncharacterized protein ENSP00000361038 homolog [Elephantulus edwardii]
MEAVSIPFLLGGLIDCLAQLIRISEELLQAMLQEVPVMEQNDIDIDADAPDADAPDADAPDADAPDIDASDIISLPDISEISDFESILTAEDDELILEIESSMIYGEDDICDNELIDVDSDIRGASRSD